MKEDKPFDAKLLRELFTKAKSQKKPLNYAFGLAAKTEDCGLIVDLKKTGAALRKDILEGKAISKASFGTLEVDGDKILFTPEKPVTGMINHLKKRFRDEGIKKFTPVLVEKTEKPAKKEDGASGAAATKAKADDAKVGAAKTEAPAKKEKSAKSTNADTGKTRDALLKTGSKIKAIGKDATSMQITYFKKATAAYKKGENKAAEKLLGMLDKSLAESASKKENPAESTPAEN